MEKRYVTRGTLAPKARMNCGLSSHRATAGWVRPARSIKWSSEVAEASWASTERGPAALMVCFLGGRVAEFSGACAKCTLAEQQAQGVVPLTVVVPEVPSHGRYVSRVTIGEDMAVVGPDGHLAGDPLLQGDH